MSEEKTYECAYCHRKWNSPEERMKCEQKCYAEHIAEQERQKEEKRRLVAELKNSRKNAKIKELQQEYEKFLLDVKQFNKDYNDPIKIDGRYYDLVNDTLLSSFILDPFKEWLNGRF